MSTNNRTPSDRRRGSRKAAKASIKPKHKQTVKAPPQPKNIAVSQEILDLFHHAFSTLFTPSLAALLQTVKQHLFNRDFLQAFGEKENLEAYVVRWSPSRALCYREVFLELSPALREVFDLRKRGGLVELVCIGGGAGAEIVAAAAAIKSLLQNEPDSTKEEDEVKTEPKKKGLESGVGSVAITSHTTSPHSLHMTAIDKADWTPVVTTLSKTITTSLSSSTSAHPLYIPPSLYSVDFCHHDILIPSETPLIPASTHLITLLFTTNELYTQSRSATTTFLLSLGPQVRPGCLLLVLESAGSYSTVQVNGKTFPMGMLLDHTLLVGDMWEKIVGEDSKWFRLPEGLRYPIELENMRFMVRVYRKT